MSGDVSNQSLSIVDFEAIEAAVMETSRGRWFLAEFSRRNRTADTGMLLEAMARIEKSMKAPSEVEPDLLGIRRDLADMADSIARTRRDIAASFVETAEGGSQPGRAFDDLLSAAEKADGETFTAAESAQEMAWSLREAGSLASAGAIDRHALDLYRASNQHALTTTRVRTLIDVLRTIEGRIHAMVGDETGPPVVADGARPIPVSIPLHEQSDDGVMFVGSPAASAPTPRREQSAFLAPPRPRELAPPPPEPRLVPFASIDALDASQRLALFV